MASNPFLDFINGAGQAGSDIFNQLFGTNPNQPTGTGSLYNSAYQPKSPVVKSVEGGVSSGLQALDKALGGQKILPVPNSPTLGDFAGYINKAAAGDTSKGVHPGYKSVLAALPMLAMGLEGDPENAAPEDTAGANAANPNKIVIPKPQVGGDDPYTFQRSTLQSTIGRSKTTINDILNNGTDASGRLYDRDIDGIYASQKQAEAKLAALPPAPNNQAPVDPFANQGNAQNTKNNPQYAYNDQATGKINSNAQIPDTGQSQAKTPYTPYSGIPEQPIPVTDRTPNVKNPNTSGNPVQVDLSSEAKRNGFYFSDQQKAQQVLDKYVPGNTAQEVEAALPKQLQEETQRIANAIGKNPQSVPSDLLAQENAANMASKGFVPGNNIKADEATRNLQKELNAQLSAGKSSIVPTSMTGEDLRNQINIMDQRLESVYKKRDLGTSLTPEDTAALTYRQTLSNKLKQLYPNVSDALDRQSAMMDAIPSVAKAAQAERDALLKQATAPKTGGGILHSLLGKVLSGSVVGGATAGGFELGKNLLPAAEMEGNKLMSYLNKPPQTASASTPGSQPPPNDQKSRYTIPDPLQAGLLMNSNDYGKQSGSLQKELDYENQYHLPMAGVTKGKLDDLKTQYDTQKPLRDAWSNPQNTGVSQQLIVANRAANSVQGADPGFFNALQAGYDKLQTASNGKYAQMSKYLQYLGSQTGTDFTQFKTKESLMGAIDTSVQTIKDNWNTQLKGYYGTPNVSSGGIPQGPAGNASQGSPSQGGATKAFAPGFNFGSQL